MRVVAGTLKGRKISFEKSAQVRPTSEKVRAAIFDILTGVIQGATVLDLFCGSGSVGIEALSRGAEAAEFVDTDTRVVQRNLRDLSLTDRAQVFRKPALQALDIMGAKKKEYDIIFIDPPYEYPQIPLILKKIDRFAIVKPDGYVILEHKKGLPLEQDLQRIRLKKLYTYGQTILRLLERYQ